MTADEMFEKIGYKKQEIKSDEELVLYKSENYIIEINNTWKDVAKYNFEEEVFTMGFAELKASLKKMEEMGW